VGGAVCSEVDSIGGSGVHNWGFKSPSFACRGGEHVGGFFLLPSIGARICSK
jgi:hypothetical protein